MKHLDELAVHMLRAEKLEMSESDDVGGILETRKLAVCEVRKVERAEGRGSSEQLKDRGRIYRWKRSIIL